MNSQSLGLPEVELILAMRQPGCPICRLEHQAESRYLRHLLAENVTDPATRARVRQSLGFCSRHTWQMAAMEIRTFGSPLGTATLCADLVSTVKALLRSIHNRRSFPQVRVAFLRRRAASILKHRPGCRVCQISGETTAFYAHRLLAHLADRDPCERDSLGVSTHICLAHLDLTLQAVTPDTYAAALCLVRGTLEHLGRLETNLEEFAAKHAWDRRGEQMTRAEETSWRAAVAFLAGEPDPGDG